ncbi:MULTISPECIES: hypothetical protein [unclassified Kitasatospora]|uniref:DUF6197 family protein n=1 Tax=unclassified Kitasatospora TaxID=2633591 RepID=UPI00070FF882|nr:MULTISPECIES: hypothetical protein [unclassified Kitasatospora]KQV15326.1 hypothetical protein ASC99_06870 [Kitasatospora sp. Root107]KRB64086.1 hypothetical protein ASE03_05985 [Kitasatospora sp. Root187]
MTSTLLAPPITLTPDASGLIAEIEAYLASLPVAATAVGPLICNYGSTAQLWYAGFPQTGPTFLDRIAHRPARPTPVSIADHLRLASRYINAFGWVQGALWDSAGRVCLLGAQAAVLAHGYGTPDTVRRARIQVMEVLHATGRPVSSPDEYNDRATTRQADVHHLLDRASARALSLGL